MNRAKPKKKKREGGGITEVKEEQNKEVDGLKGGKLIPELPKNTHPASHFPIPEVEESSQKKIMGLANPP
ncbi:hypothetical protein CEXT_350371 [Caerostris extrusa]|uniref:Uncharacterized protein n=1 Tax=Caerostris extrusa TaxID=172846 RepID=A0AAV4Y4F9_CAEEX|nr:hypothetical protein CEXT_350371 [Caerostris extrusa]